MLDNDVQPAPAPAAARPGPSGCQEVGPRASPRRLGVLPGLRPPGARAPLLSAWRCTSELTARRGEARRGDAAVRQAAHEGGARACASAFLERPGPVSPPRQTRGARARQRGARLPVASTAQPRGQESETEAGGSASSPPPSHALRRARPAHVAKPPVRSEGRSPPPPPRTPALFASQVTPQFTQKVLFFFF